MLLAELWQQQLWIVAGAQPAPDVGAKRSQRDRCSVRNNHRQRYLRRAEPLQQITARRSIVDCGDLDDSGSVARVQAGRSFGEQSFGAKGKPDPASGSQRAYGRKLLAVTSAAGPE